VRPLLKVLFIIFIVELAPTMNLLFPIYLFPCIEYYAYLVQAEEVLFEAEDHFQKQTFRNRYAIYAAGGRLSLSIPIRHKTGSRLYKDTCIAYDTDWQRHHFKSLQNAYLSSPYFEYYELDLVPLFEKKEKYLMDFNLRAFSLINDFLSLNIPIKKTEVYHDKPVFKDMRTFFNAKKETRQELEQYIQVFSNKNRFIKNLSIFDLLFNEGPYTTAYLKNIKLLHT